MIIETLFIVAIVATSIWIGWNAANIYHGRSRIVGISTQQETPKPRQAGREYRKRIVQRNGSLIAEVIEREFK